MPPPPISKLAPERLIPIFERPGQHLDATVTGPVLGRKQRQPLAESVPYDDIVLRGERLINFAQKDGYADDKIGSLTLRLGPVPVNQVDPTQTVKIIEAWLNALQRLLPRVRRMTNLRSFSILADFPFPYSPCDELSSIIEELPETCASLEIDLRHSTSIQKKLKDATATAHLCDPIRNVLHRLHHLRLRLPKICSAVFGVEDTDGYQPVKAQELKDCIVNFTHRTPNYSTHAAVAASCDSKDVPRMGSVETIDSVVPSLIPTLQSFAQLNKALERLWVIDRQETGTGKNTWAAWVRRDVRSDQSWPIPTGNIGGFLKDGWMARLPKFDSGELGTEDLISYPQTLEALAEGCTWSETRTGVRLPSTTMADRGQERAVQPRTRAELHAEERIGARFWENEEITGEKLLAEGPGPLMEKWDLNERTPHGWTRGNFTGSILVPEQTESPEFLGDLDCSLGEVNLFT